MSLVSRDHASSRNFKLLTLRVCDLKFGGDDGNRTHDPLLAGQVLSQLSYTPILGFFPSSLSLFAEDKLPQN